MTPADVKAIPEGMHTSTPHIVVRDAARAVEWYQGALGAEERSRIPVPGGKFMSVELWFGDSAVMVADEFPELGVLSPQSLGGTPVVLHLFTEDVAARWQRAVEAGAEVRTRCRTRSGATATDKSPTPSATVGGSPSTCATSRRRRSRAPRRSRSAVRRWRQRGEPGPAAGGAGGWLPGRGRPEQAYPPRRQGRGGRSTP